MGVPDWFLMLNLRLINCHLFKGLVLLPATILSLAGNLQSRTSRFTFIINIKAIVTFVTFKPKVKINDKIILSFCLKYTLKCGYKELWAHGLTKFVHYNRNLLFPDCVNSQNKYHNIILIEFFI